MKNKPILKSLKQLGLVISIVLAMPSSTVAMTNQETKSAKAQVSMEYQKARSACGSTRNNARSVCLQEAEGTYKIANAEIAYAAEPTERHLRSVAVVKADSGYAIAKEKCDDLSGDQKSLCRTEAKATHKNSLADAKLINKVNDAKAIDVKEKKDSAYEVEASKCQALSGQSHEGCMEAAKAHHKKM